MKRHNTALAVALALSAAQWTNVAIAAEQTDTAAAALASVERITVRGAYFGIKDSTSIKTPTALVNVPQSLSVVSAEQIEAQAFTSIADILQYTPGASIGQGEGHRDQMTIRGQNTTADFFIDGLRDDVQYFRPLYNLERVEILRGSNALLFGRGGGGGIVNRVTKTAQLDDSFTTVMGSLDTFGAGLVTFDHNTQIDNTQAFRLNGMYESIDNHRDFMDGDRFAINPTYTKQLNEDTRIVASYEYVDDDRLVDRGVPSLNGAPLEGFDDTFFGDPDFNRTTFEAHIARARVDHTVNDEWAVNATFQYADYDKLYQNLYPTNFNEEAGTVTLDGYVDTTERENLILQFNAVGQVTTGSLEHTLLIGAEFGQQDTDNARQEPTFIDRPEFAEERADQTTFLFTDPLNIPEVSFDRFSRDRASDVTFTSVFIQDEVRVNDWLILVGGLRYDRFEIDVVDNNALAAGNQGLFDRTDNETSPRLGAIIKPSEDLSFYASYSESFLPRSGDQFLSLSVTSATLAPEQFENREVGVKWNINDGLALTAAVFEIERENGTAVDPSDPERSILTGTETTGFEIQLVGQLTENWIINAGYSDLDGEELGRVSNGVIANRTLSQVPETMFTVWNQYQIDEKWQVGLGVIYQAEQFASLSNNVELPDFTRVDAAVFYQVSEDLSVQLNIENLFDEDYFPAAHNDNNITTGEPLNARLSVSYSF